MTTTIYLSGPMQGHVDLNRPMFELVQQGLLIEDPNYNIISPARLPEVDGWKWRDYLARDLTILLTWGIDKVVLLPNWYYSAGSKLEVYAALQADIPVFENGWRKVTLNRWKALTSMESQEIQQTK